MSLRISRTNMKKFKKIFKIGIDKQGKLRYNAPGGKS